MMYLAAAPVAALGRPQPDELMKGQEGDLCSLLSCSREHQAPQEQHHTERISPARAGYAGPSGSGLLTESSRARSAGSCLSPFGAASSAPNHALRAVAAASSQ